jgi:hypothetical protein
MIEKIVLDRILALPVDDVKALQEGRTIAALPIAQVQKGWRFMLYPHSESEFSGEVKLETWATCENFRMIHEVDQLLTLSTLTLWSQPKLEKLFEERGHLALALFRVYQLPEAIIIPESISSSIKIGKFAGFSAFRQPVQLTDVMPILSETVFANRCRQIINFCPPEYPELEALQSTIAPYIQSNPYALALDNDLKAFLGWADPQKLTKPSFDWIEEITTSGNSSDGDLFEKRVRKGFAHLGFTNTLNDPKISLDPDAAGGAGGIDFYCEFPYSIVGECKASKSLKVSDNKDGAPFQLIKLGQKYLQPAGFNLAIKIIMAPGDLTKDANITAIGNQMNILRPETLQRLVELKTIHPGSIDLLELKPCLEKAPFGIDADTKVNEFINQIEQKIKLRSQIIQSVKALKDDGDQYVTASTVRTHFNTAFAGALKMRLDTPEEAHDLLVELSSPLTGYLGRKKCAETWKGDRFYLLRELQIS